MKKKELLVLNAVFIVSAFSSAKSVQNGHGYGIIGGELASITELPHQVYTKERDSLYCGGSIISPLHILTASWCLSVPTGDIKVVAATDNSKTGGEEYAVAEITIYPNVSGLAVVKLAKEIKLSDKAKPIALAGPKYRIKDGAELIASGWGIYNEGYTKSDKLRKVTISKVGDDECKTAFHDVNLSQQFCAGSEAKKACLYDDGGPLIERTRKGNVLVGVINSFPICGEDDINLPSVFIKISQFNKWIKEVVKKDLQSRK